MATKTRLQVAAELLGQGRLADAKAKLLKEVRLAPDSAPALELLGAVLFEMGSHAEAIEYLRRALRHAPSSPGPHLNLGKALLEAGRLDEAATILADAVRRWPRIPEGHHSYGNVLHARGQYEPAVQEFGAAIALTPNNAPVYANMASALSKLHQYEAVCDVCARLLQLDPDSTTGAFLLARSRQMLCAWEGHETRLATFARHVEQGNFERGMPFVSMLLWDSGVMHRQCADLAARYYAADGKVAPLPRRHDRGDGRIRIAYVSADFRWHPVALLIAGLIEAHDRDRFEIIGISIGDDDGSADRQRMVKAFDRFVDMAAERTDAIVHMTREMQLDIAIDLMGYTQQCRPDIFAHRIAPVQATYLGFPGTTGIAAMDYLIIDPFIAAGDLPQTASEKLVILPDCYQCNVALGTPGDVPSRASCRLPEPAFVFCCFNDPKKLTLEVFDQWMRILRQVEDSVLWLLEPRAAATGANLRREAETRGVRPDRIIFAGRVSNDEHIARNGVPDLHLDTFPYNAHTTASDALRAGCPILTRAGTSFPARVCASLLTTIGVPELITYSADEYEATAVRLARDRVTLADVRRRIEIGRAQSPLFDPVRFARNLERAYAAMIELSRTGKPPAGIDVRSPE